MKTIYLELNMGAAGDMLFAALLELHPDPEGFMARMNALSLPGVHAHARPSVKCGVTGTHVDVHIHGHEEHSHDHHEGEHHEHHDHHHDHSALSDIEGLIRALPLDSRALEDAAGVYRIIADAEARAHGVPVDQVHFHEVGALDAVFDIVGVCLLMRELNVEEVVASNVRVGFGMVSCQHGILPVPAPATAHIIMSSGMPIYAGRFEGELLTPTGAALIARFANRFSEMPAMRVSKIGYGMGKKDFPAANCVRAFLGERAADERADEVIELACDIDDMTGEALAYAQQALMDAGALDAVLRPVQMKKGRPGVTLTALCAVGDEERIAQIIFKHTSTIGMRKARLARYCLTRTTETLETRFGKVTAKVSKGFGVSKCKIEFEDIKRIALEQNKSIDEIRSMLK